MQLDPYLREKKLTDESFAALLGPDVSTWAVRKWRYGQRVPRLAMQQRISAATEGAVTANDFVAAAIAADRRREDAAHTGAAA
ncbi:XRE family transcriptional regulator [Methylobacterium sp. HMF5984]|uniref:XRE family transcriptional regulator n=1 Tax=Methylobacterium sp. HMF5984 TaxID=3367370 RepID=UPI0038553FF3